MQQLVGIVRQESEMQEALERLNGLRARAELAGIGGNREYNAGWHTALDLPNLILVSEAVTRAGLERRESRGAHFRDDFPTKVDEYSTFNLVIERDGDGAMKLTRAPVADLPPELQQVVEENK
jgi:succinate dehydrogenase / fumarate reductase flavoprotein subunit